MRVYTEEEVAKILYSLFQDECACNYNGIDEWLPEVCEYEKDCPNPKGLGCWGQFLRNYTHREVINEQIK